MAAENVTLFPVPAELVSPTKSQGVADRAATLEDGGELYSPAAILTKLVVVPTLPVVNCTITMSSGPMSANWRVGALQFWVTMMVFANPGHVPEKLPEAATVATRGEPGTVTHAALIQAAT